MTVTVDVKNNTVLNLLRNLETLNLIQVDPIPAKEGATITPAKTQLPNIYEFLRQAPLDGVVIERDTNTVLRGTDVFI